MLPMSSSGCGGCVGSFTWKNEITRLMVINGKQPSSHKLSFGVEFGLILKSNIYPIGRS